MEDALGTIVEDAIVIFVAVAVRPDVLDDHVMIRSVRTLRA